MKQLLAYLLYMQPTDKAAPLPAQLLLKRHCCTV